MINLIIPRIMGYFIFSLSFNFNSLLQGRQVRLKSPEFRYNIFPVLAKFPVMNVTSRPQHSKRNLPIFINASTVYSLPVLLYSPPNESECIPISSQDKTNESNTLPTPKAGISIDITREKDFFL